METRNERFGGLTGDRKRSETPKTVSVTCFECERHKDARDTSPTLDRKLGGAE